MQLNVYVPAERTALLLSLDAVARRRAMQKNTLVLDAIEHYLRDVLEVELEGEMPELQTFSMGEVRMPARGELNDEYLDRLFGTHDPAR